jgi:putative ABC transport system permease protein
MSDRDFNKMMNFECLFYGMRTLLFGLPLAGIISWLIYEGLMAAERMDSFDYVFPWGSMAISAFGVFFVVSITMLYAIGRIKRENIIDALRDDMA